MKGLEDVAPERRLKVLELLLDYAARVPIEGLSEEDRRFLVPLANQLADDPGGVRLDHAFGLRVRGGVSPAQRAGIDERNALLVDLWRNMPDWQSVKVSGVASLMAASFHRYETSRWERERDDVTPPAKEPYQTWWKILAMGERLPKPRRIIDILNLQSKRPFELQRS